MPRTHARPGAGDYSGVIVRKTDNDIWIQAFCVRHETWHNCVWRPDCEEFQRAQVGGVRAGLTVLREDPASGTIELTTAPLQRNDGHSNQVFPRVAHDEDDFLR